MRLPQIVLGHIRPAANFVDYAHVLAFWSRDSQNSCVPVAYPTVLRTKSLTFVVCPSPVFDEER